MTRKLGVLSLTLATISGVLLAGGLWVITGGDIHDEYARIYGRHN